MEIYSLEEAKIVEMTMNTVKEIGLCAKESRYYRDLFRRLALPEFIHYEFALDYFMDTFRRIKWYIAEHGVFPAADDRQRKLCVLMDRLKYVEFADEESKERLHKWELKGDPLVINNHDDGVLFMTVASLVNDIKKEADEANEDDDYFNDLYDQIPNIFNDYHKNRGIKYIAQEVLKTMQWYIKVQGWIDVDDYGILIIKAKYDKLQKLMSEQK